MSERIHGTIESVGRRSAFVVSLPEQSDTATAEALKIARAEYSRRPKSLIRALAVDYSEGYVRQMIAGSAPMSLKLYVRLLASIPREAACASATALIQPIGLDVIYAQAAPVNDLKTATVEAAGACGEVFTLVNESLKDDCITANESNRIDRAVKVAESKFETVVRSVPR